AGAGGPAGSGGPAGDGGPVGDPALGIPAATDARSRRTAQPGAAEDRPRQEPAADAGHTRAASPSAVVAGSAG
ncbi:hypothetical protein FraQA3DRAFT_5167, partial [Frankia sp. QA3]